MVGILTSNRIYFLIRCILAGVFFYSGAGKLLDVQGFSVVISGYGLLPDQLNLVAAAVLPVAELVIAAGLVWDIKGSLSSYSFLLVVFMGVLAHGINMGLDVDCGCFAPGDPEGAAYHSLRGALLRDFILLGACAYLYFLRRFKGYRSRSVFSIISRG